MRKRTEITSADTKQIGYEYQYLYFILRLLQLSLDEEVGYEALDDVHVIDTSKRETVYIQVKHTTGTAVSGTTTNLARLSVELWKTLSNWSKLVIDPTENREKVEMQRRFLERSRFLLVVNREIANNEVINLIETYKANNIKASTIRDYLNELKQETKDNQIKQYIDDVISLSPNVLTAFIKRIDFESSTENLFRRLREEIRKKMIDDDYIDDVLGALYLQLKKDFFDTVQSGKHQSITYTEWVGKYRRIFTEFRTTLLPFREYNPVLPEHLEQQFFVKELTEIGALDVTESGLPELAELTEFYLKTELQLNDWYNEGKITLIEQDRFHKNAILIWKRIHQASHRTTKTDINRDYSNALICYDDVMKEELALLQTDLGMELSNGEFIKLANDKKIGWRYHWLNRRESYGNQSI